ncbi:MAG: hypothetical protein AB1779_04155, partial [Candidatus Thermoplasmatota archaeon]
TGEVLAYDINVKFYLGEPENNGILLGNFSIEKISAGKNKTAYIVWQSSKLGNYTVCAKVQFNGENKIVKTNLEIKEFEKEEKRTKPTKKNNTYIWLLFTILFGVWLFIAIISLRRRSKKTIIEDVFLIYTNDGRLITHSTRRLTPNLDGDIITGTLTAVQDFVRQSFKGREEGMLEEFKYGDFKFLIEHGQLVSLAVGIRGSYSEEIREKMRKIIYEIEYNFANVLLNWDGNVEKIGPSAARIISRHLMW